MQTCAGSAARADTVWLRFGLWLSSVSFLLLCSSCAVAHMPRAAAVEDMVAGDQDALGPEDILRRGEAYYQFMRSYSYFRSNVEGNQLDEALAAMQEALRAQPEVVF